MQRILLITIFLGGFITAFGQNNTFTDTRDGQCYKYVVIGNQVWMAENLNYKMDNSWEVEDSSGNAQDYGRLYNWDAAQRACPDGWHLPSDEEWSELVDFIGGDKTSSNKLKKDEGWNRELNGTDDFGFSALPAGFRWKDGTIRETGVNARFWTSTPYSNKAFSRSIYNVGDEIYRVVFHRFCGYSVRCVKNK